VERHRNTYPDLVVAGIEIPSYTWRFYLFSLKHPPHAISLQYTGALNIKHNVQVRTLRAYHPDSQYNACIFKMTKLLGIVAAQIIKKYTEFDEEEAHVVFYSFDNKAKVNVGEPHLAVSFGGRGCRSILPNDV
jgi:hypothetical protein